MPAKLFRDFLASRDTLWIYRGNKPVFTSAKDGLLPLLEYLAAGAAGGSPVTVYDKIMGNAAALLSVLAGAREVYSPLGSALAVRTLEKHGIKYHLDKVVPCVRRDDGRGMCPMEELSLGKAPEEFFQIMQARLR